MYASTVWTSTSSKDSLNRVLKLQKRAARIILNCQRTTSEPSVNLFNKLGWLPFYEEVKIRKCCLAFQRVNESVPTYLLESLTLNSQIHGKKTRHSEFNMICPKYIRKLEGGRSFKVTTTQLWNSLDIKLRSKPSLLSFKKNFKKYLLEQQKCLKHFKP